MDEQNPANKLKRKKLLSSIRQSLSKSRKSLSSIRGKITRNRSTLIITVAVFSILGNLIFLPDIIEILPRLLSVPETKLIGSIIILSIGYLLYIFKKKQQFWYGVFETIFALLSCLIAFEIIERTLLEKHIELATFATIGSTIYLVVRGISNINDGYKSAFFLKKSFLDIIHKDRPEKPIDYFLLSLTIIISFAVIIYFFYLFALYYKFKVVIVVFGSIVICIKTMLDAYKNRNG